MNKGNETWKWGMVFVLLAVFLVTANQAYVHISSLEDFEPPDDYLMGDSWDLEQRSGPGTAQGMGRPFPGTQDGSSTAVDTPTQGEPVIRIREDVDWGELEDGDISDDDLSALTDELEDMSGVDYDSEDVDLDDLANIDFEDEELGFDDDDLFVLPEEDDLDESD